MDLLIAIQILLSRQEKLNFRKLGPPATINISGTFANKLFGKGFS